MADEQQQTQQQQTQQQGSQVQLENKTERVMHITLEGGAIISVPPLEQGAQTVTFADADERARFERALQTDAVRHWIENKELVVHGQGALTPEQLAAKQQAAQQQSGQQQQPSAASTSHETSPEVSRTTSRTRGGRE